MMISLILIGSRASFSETMTSDAYAIPSNVIDSFGGSGEASSSGTKIYYAGGQPSVVGTSESPPGPNYCQMAMGFIYTIFGGANRPGTLECERLADGNIRIKWLNCNQTDIYVLVPAPGDYYNYNGPWTYVTTTTESEWVDNSSSGCVQKYYRVRAAGTDMYALAPSGSIEAVGKFELDLPNSQDHPERLFISTPLEPFNPSITAEIGNQAANGDLVGIFDINLNPTVLAQYYEGKWRDTSTGDISNMDIRLGQGYVYYTLTPHTVVMVGRVYDHDHVSTLEGGDINTKCVYIAPAFPTAPKDIKDAGLEGSSKGWSPYSAGSVGLVDLYWNTLGFAMHTDTNYWEVLVGSSLEMEPGRGYLFMEPVKNSVTWVQKP